MIDQSLKELLESASTFVGTTATATVKLQQGAGVVADIIFNMADIADTALNAIRASDVFDSLSLLQIVSINALQTAMNELKGGVVHVVAEQYQPDFSSIYARPTGGILTGFSSVAGDLAGSPDNVMYWVSSLKEASRNENFSEIISFSGQQAGKPYNIFVTATSSTPITIDSDFDAKMVDLTITAKGAIETETDIASIFGKITTLFSALVFDEDLIPDDSADKDLVRLEGVKSITVGPDDTLQSIAYNELGSADRWREIAAINDIIVENPVSVYLPIGTTTYATDLAAGTNIIPFAGLWTSTSVAVGSLIQIEDTAGKKQRLTVKEIIDTVSDPDNEYEHGVYFRETFSQYFTGPISITRYDNRSDYGTYDTTTTLSQASVAPSKTLYLASAKDVFKDYILRIAEGAASYFYTVAEVDYLSDSVTVKEASAGHAKDRVVEIYDVHNRLYHLESGTVLKVPKAAGNASAGNIVQSYSEIFGTDLELDGDGLLAISDGDFGALSGLENFKQALVQRINCPYTSLLFHPEYGCGLWNIIGEKNTPYYETMAKASVIDSLGHEPRIDKIAQFNMTTTADSIQFGITVNPVEGNSPSDLNFVVTTGA